MLDEYRSVSIRGVSEWRARVKRLALTRLEGLIDYMASVETLPEGIELDDTQTLYQRIAACDGSGSDVFLASAVTDLFDTTQWQALVRQFQSETDETHNSFEQVQQIHPSTTF